MASEVRRLIAISLKKLYNSPKTAGSGVRSIRDRLLIAHLLLKAKDVYLAELLLAAKSGKNTICTERTDSEIINATSTADRLSVENDEELSEVNKSNDAKNDSNSSCVVNSCEPSDGFGIQSTDVSSSPKTSTCGRHKRKRPMRCDSVSISPAKVRKCHVKTQPSMVRSQHIDQTPPDEPMDLSCTYLWSSSNNMSSCKNNEASSSRIPDDVLRLSNSGSAHIPSCSTGDRSSVIPVFVELLTAS